MNQSLWVDSDLVTGEVTVGPALDENTSADVAIVGGGFTGLWTAYYLTKLDPSITVCIIDARYPGFGASGRNGGWVSALFPAHLTALARSTSTQDALRMHQAMVNNIGDIGAVIREHDWNVDWAHGGTVVAARTPIQLERAHAAVQEMQSWGLGDDLMYMNREDTLQQLGATDVLGGTFTPHCAAINPYLLVSELVRYLENNGVKFYRHSPVTEMSPGIIRTRTGSVRAPITIRATEGYTRTIRGYTRTLAPVYSLMLATEPLSKAQIGEIGLQERQTFSDYRNLVIYGQRTADDRIAFGGRGAPYFFGSRISDSQDRNHKVHRELWQTLTDMFPILRSSRVTHTWGGPLGIARDWWASCGLDRSTGEGWSGGYVGDGVGTSHLGGKTLAHLITKTESDVTTLAWVGHRSPSWEPEPLRWLGANAGLQIMQRADDYEDRTGKQSRAAQVVGRLLGQ